jgi:hypothetical protein
MRKLVSLAEARRTFIRARDPALAVWVTSVDAARNLKDAWVQGRTPGFRRMGYDRALANTELLEASLEQLDDAVRACRIRLRGTRDPTKTPKKIDKREQQIGVLDIWASTLTCGGRVYHEVQCYEDEVEREIARPAGTVPAQEAPATDASPPLPEVNVSGRHTDRDRIKAEARRRLDANENVPRKLIQFARQLRQWLQKQPDPELSNGQVMAVDTIEGHVRPMFNEFRGKKKG